MNTVASILRDDALAREIARKVPLLRAIPAALESGTGEIEAFALGAPPEQDVTRPHNLVAAPLLPADTTPAEARAQIEATISNAAFSETTSINEAIIKRFGRPVLLVRNDTFEIPAADTWKAILFPNKSKLDRVLPSVGRVELVSMTPPFVGTAWMVTEDIAVTNRHVALTFARKQQNQWQILRTPIGQQLRVRVDFKEEYLQSVAFEAEVIDILFVAELTDDEPDLALIRLRSTGRPLPPPIPLFDGELRLQQKVAVIGYPAEDPRNGAADQQRIFANIFDVKRLAPGELTGVDNDLYFTHDCTTLGGNSGSVVLDVETGTAVGLHFAGEYLLNNYAVRASKVREVLQRLGGNIVLPTPTVPPQPQTFTTTTGELGRRRGYDPHFLGDEQLAVPLPQLNEGLRELAVIVDADAGEGTEENDEENGEENSIEKYLLNYTHFSVAMHQERRMAIFTATNIDGDKSQRIKRQSDAWGFDPRIPEQFQIGNALYAGNDLDRGHLVRRLDPAWGSDKVAKQAEKDTFYFTNCTPQHSGFNQRLWLQLEDYLLNSTDTRNFKACIFTGPIFTLEDHPYRDALIPLSYWKVAVMIHDVRNELTATAYIVSQKDLLTNLEFVFGQFKTYQMPVAELEQRTNLDFGNLKQFDPLRQEEAIGPRELLTRADIRL